MIIYMIEDTDPIVFLGTVGQIGKFCRTISKLKIPTKFFDVFCTMNFFSCLPPQFFLHGVGNLSSLLRFSKLCQISKVSTSISLLRMVVHSPIRQYIVGLWYSGLLNCYKVLPLSELYKLCFFPFKIMVRLC